MDIESQIVGNPITLTIERCAYLALGIFFVAAFFSAVYRNYQDKL